MRMAILSYSDKKTKSFYLTGIPPRKVGWENIQKVAIRKLDLIEYADRLDDLKSPPNNRLEKLSGNLHGFHSIRINDQWRIIFKWTDMGATDVAIIDYH